ncbi:MAG: c-type cytochrome [Bacteroidia bacterium]
MKYIAIGIFGLVIYGLSSCHNSDRKRQQYISMGRMVYQKQCTNCHQKDGNGYEALYPPLNNSDYLNQDPLKSLCIIINGAKGEMVVNGSTYNMPMPNFRHLKADELAKLMTYITNSWDNKGRLYTDEEMAEAMQKCN